MRSKLDLARCLLDHAHRTMSMNVETLSLDEALFVPEGGYRSILGTLKHAAGWSHVYHSYAFDSSPKHWNEIDWPHKLRDTIIKTKDYVDDVIAWFDKSHYQWMESLSSVDEASLDEPRPLHWGENTPLFDIIVLISGHHLYHAGEINQILSICRGEAWEDGEEVEENNISTLGHRVTPSWLEENES